MLELLVYCIYPSGLDLTMHAEYFLMLSLLSDDFLKEIFCFLNIFNKEFQMKWVGFRSAQPFYRF